MSLDKFGVIPKKKESKSKSKSKIKTKKTTVRKKYYLKCTARCGYKRVLNKRNLKDEDYICRKCKKKMKVYKTK